MSIDNEFSRYFPKLEKLQEFMVGDLRRSSIEAYANFLVAMGVFNYVEILGSFYKYRNSYKVRGMQNRQTGIPRFNFAIRNFFDSSYKKEFTKIMRLFGKPPYDMFRSGMTHEYLVKTYKGKTNNKLYFSVVNPSNRAGYDALVEQEKCGIKVDKIDRNTYVVVLVCPKLVEDFNLAFEKYKQYLKANQGKYRIHFIHRANDINLGLMN